MILLDEEQTVKECDPNSGQLITESRPTRPKADSQSSYSTKLHSMENRGGQVGDDGDITGDDLAFEVCDTQKYGDLTLHVGSLTSGVLKSHLKVKATVGQRRQAIRRAHSATHILHYALQNTLGKHAQQQGSKVEGDALRFDFTNLEPVSEGDLQKIEQIVHERVAAAEPISAKILPLPEAREAGAMMLFGEKYPDPVRMVSMGEFSRELCARHASRQTRRKWRPLRSLKKQGSPQARDA